MMCGARQHAELAPPPTITRVLQTIAIISDCSVDEVEGRSRLRQRALWVLRQLRPELNDGRLAHRFEIEPKSVANAVRRIDQLIRVDDVERAAAVRLINALQRPSVIQRLTELRRRMTTVRAELGELEAQWEASFAALDDMAPRS